MIRRRPLTMFFVLAYLGSWLAWSPWWLSQSGIGLLPWRLSMPAIIGINQLGLFAGPFAAALVVSRLADGPGGPRSLLRRFLRWRVHPGWYALALVVVPAATVTGYVLATGGEWSPAVGGVAAASTLAGRYLVFLLGGPVQEELGWRGFALPRLQRRWHPLLAAILLGLLHCLWHAPLFLVEEWDTPRQDLGQLVAYLVLVLSMSIVMSWLWNGSRGSVLLVVLGHNSINWAVTSAVDGTGQPYTDTWPAALGLALLALVAIVVSRGRLRAPAAGLDDDLRGTSA